VLGIFDTAIFDHNTFDAATNQLVADQAVYTVAGQIAVIRHDWQLVTNPGAYDTIPGTSNLVHGYNFFSVTAVYQYTGYSPRIYESSFFYVDNEIIYVPWSQSSIMVSGENRTIALLPTATVEELAEYRTETAEPRLRVVS
jgi:hypothetical protein